MEFGDLKGVWGEGSRGRFEMEVRVRGEILGVGLRGLEGGFRGLEAGFRGFEDRLWYLWSIVETVVDLEVAVDVCELNCWDDVVLVSRLRLLLFPLLVCVQVLGLVEVVVLHTAALALDLI